MCMTTTSFYRDEMLLLLDIICKYRKRRSGSLAEGMQEQTYNYSSPHIISALLKVLYFRGRAYVLQAVASPPVICVEELSCSKTDKELCITERLQIGGDSKAELKCV